MFANTAGGGGGEEEILPRGCRASPAPWLSPGWGAELPRSSRAPLAPSNIFTAPTAMLPLSVLSPGGAGRRGAGCQEGVTRLLLPPCPQTPQAMPPHWASRRLAGRGSVTKTPHHGDVLSPSPEQRLRWAGLGCCWMPTTPGTSTPLWVAPPRFYTLKSPRVLTCMHSASHLGAVQPHRIGGGKTAPRPAGTRFILPTERQH